MAGEDHSGSEITCGSIDKYFGLWNMTLQGSDGSAGGVKGSVYTR